MSSRPSYNVCRNYISIPMSDRTAWVNSCLSHKATIYAHLKIFYHKTIVGILEKPSQEGTIFQYLCRNYGVGSWAIGFLSHKATIYSEYHAQKMMIIRNHSTAVITIVRCVLRGYSKEHVCMVFGQKKKRNHIYHDYGLLAKVSV